MIDPNDNFDDGSPQENAAFGARLHSVLTALNLNRNQAAKRLGVSAGYLGKVVAGRVCPSSNLLRKAKREFRASSDWLLTGEGEMFDGAAIDLGLLRGIGMQTELASRALGGKDDVAERVLKRALSQGDDVQLRLDPSEAALLKSLESRLDGLAAIGQIYNSVVRINDGALRWKTALNAAVAAVRATSVSTQWTEVLGLGTHRSGGTVNVYGERASGFAGSQFNLGKQPDQSS